MILRLNKSIRGLNQYLRWHWAVRKKDLKDWEKQLLAACNGRIPKVKGKASVTIVSHRKRLLDTDNLWGGVKPVLDAMRNLGIIVDDNPNMLFLQVSQIKIPQIAFTEIKLGAAK